MTEETNELKAAYAALLLRSPKEAFKAAMLLFPGETSRALKVSNEWPMDSIVIKEMARLEKAGLNGLPSKNELALKIWEMVEDDRGSKNPQWAIAPKDRIAAGKLYADIMGFIATNEPLEDDEDTQKIPVYKVVDK